MISYLMIGPEEEPVSIDTAMTTLGADQTERGLVSTLVAAARLHVESVTGLALVRQQWRLVMDRWPTEEFSLPVGPVTTIEAARYFDQIDTEHAIDPEAVRLHEGKVSIEVGSPMVRDRQGVEVDYWAGYGAAAQVPVTLCGAVVALADHWFKHRDAVLVAGGGGAIVPDGFDTLIANYRRAPK